MFQHVPLLCLNKISYQEVFSATCNIFIACLFIILVYQEHCGFTFEDIWGEKREISLKRHLKRRYAICRAPLLHKLPIPFWILKLFCTVYSKLWEEVRKPWILYSWRFVPGARARETVCACLRRVARAWKHGVFALRLNFLSNRQMSKLSLLKAWQKLSHSTHSRLRLLQYRLMNKKHRRLLQKLNIHEVNE